MNFKLTETNKFLYESIPKNDEHINKQWAEVVEQRMETLYKCLQGGISSIQFKELEDLSDENQLHTIRNVYGNYGDLLYYWPDIYACVETHKKTLID